jgi:hypothetical protein
MDLNSWNFNRFLHDMQGFAKAIFLFLLKRIFTNVHFFVSMFVSDFNFLIAWNSLQVCFWLEKSSPVLTDIFLFFRFVGCVFGLFQPIETILLL